MRNSVVFLTLLFCFIMACNEGVQPPNDIISDAFDMSTDGPIDIGGVEGEGAVVHVDVGAAGHDRAAVDLAEVVVEHSVLNE